MNNKDIEYCCFCDRELTNQSITVNVEVQNITSSRIIICPDCANKLSEIIRTGGLVNVLREFLI